jgi:hypothetical protein
MPVMRVIVREGHAKVYHDAQASIHTPDRTLQITRNQDSIAAFQSEYYTSPRHLRAYQGPKARILDADSLPWTPTLTFYKLLEIERIGYTDAQVNLCCRSVIHCRSEITSLSTRTGLLFLSHPPRLRSHADLTGGQGLAYARHPPHRSEGHALRSALRVLPHSRWGSPLLDYAACALLGPDPCFNRGEEATHRHLLYDRTSRWTYARSPSPHSPSSC